LSQANKQNLALLSPNFHIADFIVNIYGENIHIEPAEGIVQDISSLFMVPSAKKLSYLKTMRSMSGVLFWT